MVPIVFIFVLIGAGGFFALAEAALIRARKSRMQAFADQGQRSARRVLRMLEHPERVLTTAQVGITAVAVMSGLVAGLSLAPWLEPYVRGWGLTEGAARALSRGVVTVAVIYLQCWLGELVPGRVGGDAADRMARLCSGPMLAFSRLTWPVVRLLVGSSGALIRLFPRSVQEDDNRVTEEEIKSVIQEGTDAGEVQEVEQDIMERALVLGDQTVDQLMTHRADLVTLDVGMTATEVENMIRQHPYSTYPVTRDDDPDSVCGIVRLKDLVLILNHRPFSLLPIIKEPHYFPENMTVYNALEQFKREQRGRALVCDEYGSLQGIISLKDILEGLVGTISEPTEAPDIEEHDDHESWTVSGQCLFYDFLAYFDAEDNYTTDFTTLGGLVLDLMERIPQEGDHVSWRGFELTVERMDGQRIDKILVRRTPPSTQPAAD